MPAVQHRANNFDGLRLLAAIAVLVSHQFALAGRIEPAAGPYGSPGGLAVIVFFALSGYLVSSSWGADPDVPRFLARRLLRIWPGFAAVVLTCVAAVIWFDPDPPFGAIAAQAYLSNLYFSGFDWYFFQGLPRPQMNGSLWTIPFEVSCYLVVAAVAPLAGRRVRWLWVGALVALAAWFTHLGGQPAFDAAWGKPDFPFFAYFGAAFMVGACLFHFSAERAGWIIATGLLCASLGERAAATVLVVPALSIWIGVRSWPVLRSASRFGDFSYGTYLWAWPATQVGVLLLGKDAPLPLLLGRTLLMTGAVALVSWHTIERPALRMKPGRGEVLRSELDELSTGVYRRAASTLEP
jgi:peptidoglycan/LPS O-acetylase OafA/YrhL